MSCDERSNIKRRLTPQVELIPQVEANTEGIAGIHRPAVLGARSIMPRACPGKLQSAFIEPGAPRGLNHGRRRSQAPLAVHAYAHRRGALVPHKNGSRGIEIIGARESN